MNFFEIKKGEEFIELNNLLKLESLVNSGGEAKAMIQNGQVLVNNETETRVRKKLRSGDIVSFNEQTITIK